MDTQESFSTSEVAKYCHVTADTIRKWAEAGRIQVFKTPGGHRRIRREDLIMFLRENDIPVHSDLIAPGFKILVVDHENSVGTVIQRFLDRARTTFQVEVTRDPFEAGRQLAMFRPDVVFLDLELPGVDALTICQRIRSLSEHSGAQVIIMSTKDDPDLARQTLEYGASLCLPKPFTPDDLRRALACVGIEVT